jgi:hypothetical protein
MIISVTNVVDSRRLKEVLVTTPSQSVAKPQ